MGNGPSRDEARAERARRIQKAESTLICLTTSSGTIPCTRLQWAAWVGDHVGELRRRMRKEEAPMRRREGNIRICARPGLPPPVKRFLPLEDRRCVIKEWAQLLAWRTGWHGLAAASGRRMFYMLRHVNSTCVIDLESQRVDGRHPYHLKEDFVLSDHIIPLTAFELKFNSDVVHTVFHFHVEGTPCDAGGINLRPVRALVITSPLPYRKIAAEAKGEDDTDDEVDADEVAEDSCEDLCDEHPASDLDEDELVVDTDGPSVDESCNSVTSSDSSGVEEADVPAVDAAKGERSATGGRGPAPLAVSDQVTSARSTNNCRSR